MDIIFDLTSLQSQQLTGIGNCTLHLAKALLNEGEVKLKGSVKLSSFNKKKNILAHLPQIQLSTYLPFFDDVRLSKNTIFHGPDYWIPKGGKFKKVITIHDLSIYEEGLWPKERRLRGVEKISKILTQHKPDAIITVSDFTKNEIIKYFPNLESKVYTIYNGIDHFQDLSTGEIPFDFPYFLYLGTIEKRKNVLELAKAFQLFRSNNPEVHLVLAGGAFGFESEEIMAEINKKYSQHIHFMGYTPLPQLHNLLKSAEALIYPSLYEGFGMPILEAMRMRVPVVTSGWGAMKEIAGNAAVLIENPSCEAIALKMSEVYRNESLKKKNIELGVSRAEFFKWQNQAKETIKLYKSLL